MKRLSVSQMRVALSRLDQLLDKEGEVLITRRGQVIARLLPARTTRMMPSHARLRAEMPRLAVESEVLIGDDRDRT